MWIMECAIGQYLKSSGPSGQCKACTRVQIGIKVNYLVSWRTTLSGYDGHFEVECLIHPLLYYKQSTWLAEIPSTHWLAACTSLILIIEFSLIESWRYNNILVQYIFEFAAVRSIFVCWLQIEPNSVHWFTNDESWFTFMTGLHWAVTVIVTWM